MSNTPAGWYPQGDGQQRYWDGENWTEHFAPRAEQPVTSSAAAPIALSDPMIRTERSWFKKKRFIIPAGVVGLVIAGSALGSGGDETPVAAAQETTSAASATTNPPTVAPSAKPTQAPSQAAPAPSTVAPAPAPKPKIVSFDGSGTYEVGSEVKPGLYRSEGGGYWERLKDVTGDFDDIIANGNPAGQAYVQIRKADGYFSTSGNEEWVLVDAKAKGQLATSFSGDGMYMVGVDIKPGTYTAAGSGYWERLSNAGGDFDAIIANDNPQGKSIVKIKKTDKFFSTNGMEEWSLVK